MQRQALLQDEILEALEKRRLSKDVVRRVVDSLLDGIDTAPTDLEVLATRLEVLEIQPRHDLPYSAALERSDGGLRIVYSSDQRESARRFSIAHELGHAYLCFVTPALDQRVAWVESFCDHFATEILFPSAVTARVVGDLDLERFFAAARMFKSSLRRTALRLAELTDASIIATDRESLLWTAGPTRGLDSFLVRRMATVIEFGNHIREGVTDGRSKRNWSLEAKAVRGRAVAILKPAAG
jgi:hypothetical protein